ncbi:MAG: hypothetical protein WEB09_09160 [Nitriliruptor sp.]
MTLIVSLLAGCASSTDTPSRAAAPTDRSDASAEDAAPTVEVAGGDLVLVAGAERRTLASVEAGELLHAVLRPTRSPDGVRTVLALGRDEGRFELRYLNIEADGERSDLYWFPLRMQVADDVARVSDVPTLPVWAPDGSAVAWLEWGPEGTRLRTVGWFDHDAGTNPSDDQATYDLEPVPVGTQLEAWEVGDDGAPELVTRGSGDDRWRIRIEGDEVIVALDAL